MIIIDLLMNIVYGVCLFGFCLVVLRSLWVMKVYWQCGYSVLEWLEIIMNIVYGVCLFGFCLLVGNCKIVMIGNCGPC